VAEIAPLRPGDPSRIGDYELKGRVGEGGQGSVFLGTASSGEQVAVKVLRHGLARPGTGDLSAPGRFLRETEILRRVAPFCTAQVVESGTMDGLPYIVSEYIDGPDLQQVVDEEGPLRNTRLRRLAIGTMTALAAIHRAGVVHRDFKPSNVLLGRDGPRVIDFGIARALDASATGSGVVGTPPYMAPEQLEAASVKPPADLFAWGSTMVFAATGRPPFGMDSLPAVVNRILHKEPELGDLEGDLRELIADCLSKDPAGRPVATEALLRLLGARRPLGTDLLSAGTAVASGTPEHPRDALAGATPASVPDIAPHATAAFPPAGAKVVTVPRDRAVGRLGSAWLVGAAAALALASGAAVWALSRHDGLVTATGPPETTAGRPRAIAEVTAAPSPATSNLRLPGLRTTLHETPADPVRMTSFMYNTTSESRNYARDPRSGGFEPMGPYQEALVSPDGKWTALLPWLKDSIPQTYDFVRLIDRPTGRQFVVRLTDKSLHNFFPFWSPDGRRLLLTTFDESSGTRKPVGFVIVDASAAKATPVKADVPGANSAPFQWAPGENAVAQRYGAGYHAGLAFFDLRGKTIRTLPGVGETVSSESVFSPAGKWFITACPAGYTNLCVWDTTTGRRRTSFPVPRLNANIGWYNDAHIMLVDRTKDTWRVVVMNLKGKVVRVLADIPPSEDNGSPGRAIYHYTRR
jgi:hypothetical protein